MFALSLVLLFLLAVVLLQLGGANDEVELGHGDDPWVTVRTVERNLEGNLPDEAWRKKQVKCFWIMMLWIMSVSVKLEMTFKLLIEL